ncbi:MAG: hypothetical protein ACLQGU_08715 [bacterium]
MDISLDINYTERYSNFVSLTLALSPAERGLRGAVWEQVSHG